MGRLAQRYGRRRERGRALRRCRFRYLGRFADQPPQPLHETPGALHATLGPFHVALGRRIRQHEPAGDIGAVAGDDLVRIDRVALRLRHFLDRADLDRLAGLDQRRACARRPASRS